MKTDKVNKEFDKKIIESITKKYPAIAWNTIDSVIVKTQLTIKAFRKDYSEIELFIPDINKEDFSRLLAGDTNFRVYIPDLSVAFNLEIKSFLNSNIVTVHMPESYTFHERRKSERVLTEDYCYAYIKYKTTSPKVKVYDVSMGGFSVVYPKSLKVDIEKNKIYENIYFEISGHRINGKFKCVNTVVLDPYKVEQLPYGGFKVAFRFEDISSEDLNYLREYITNSILKGAVYKKAE